ncbi:hypothetical protein [Nonomuraea sp. SYSU D8015]|uniref:hypothetical protein n=1 Tax=Nonomuraea sp. SYSU D8015 TaxID=2593644 RepID=UPI0016615D97|nr:hypothetical protein [Nonomuraea sp. SYSU D8015]
MEEAEYCDRIAIMDHGRIAVVDSPRTPASLPRLFAELGVPIRSVQLTRPSLEDVFLAHTGTTIRGDALVRADGMAMTRPARDTTGALFPIAGLPAALQAPAPANPLTHAVDLLRQAILGHLGATGRPVTWGGVPVPAWAESGLLAAMGLIFLALAAAQFRRAD